MQKEKKIQSEKIVTLDSQKMNQNNFKKSKSNHNIYSIHPIFKLLLYVPEQQKKKRERTQTNQIECHKKFTTNNATCVCYILLHSIWFSSI